jgi:predicted HicB family RNase H-like nuclease
MKKMKTAKNENYLTYKGYIGSIEFSLPDNCLHGQVVGLDKGLIAYEGTTLDELKKDFQDSVDDYLSYCEENNIEPQKVFTGRFNVRLTPELHRSAVAKAREKGISLNRLVRLAVEHELSI